jgi:DNA-binding transcriptional LysR family regulator
MELSTGFDLKALRAFVQVAESGGMTAAASRLGMTQSSVSQLIANLETAVGTTLFDRNVRPIALTSSGMILFDQSRSILAMVGDTFQMIREREHRQLPNLTIAMPDSLANSVGPMLVKEHMELARRWRIWAGISSASELLSHSADLAITTGDELDIVEGLEIHSIMAEPFILVMSADYKGPVSWDELCKQPFIRYSLRSKIGQQIEQQITRLRLNLPARVEFDSVPSQLFAITNGLGWSITTPTCLLQNISLLDQLRIEPIKKGEFYRTIKLVARENDLGKLTQTVAANIRRLLKQECLPKLYPKLPWIEDSLIWPSKHK